MREKYCIGLVKFDLFFPNCRSLKEKKSILQGIKTKIRNNFNVSVAELTPHDLWQRVKIGVVSIINDRSALDSIINDVIKLITSNKNVTVLGHEVIYY